MVNYKVIKAHSGVVPSNAQTIIMQIRTVFHKIAPEMQKLWEIRVFIENQALISVISPVLWKLSNSWVSSKFDRLLTDDCDYFFLGFSSKESSIPPFSRTVSILRDDFVKWSK